MARVSKKKGHVQGACVREGEGVEGVKGMEGGYTSLEVGLSANGQARRGIAREQPGALWGLTEPRCNGGESDARERPPRLE